MKTNTTMKKPIALLLTTGLIAICLLLMAGCGSDSDTEAASSYEDTDFAMGTVVTQTIYSDDKGIAPHIIELLTDTESKYISWRSDDSEVAKINANSGDNNGISISDETRGYIENALRIAGKADGAFDPTIGMLSRLWDFDNAKNIVPPDKEITQLLSGVGYENISLNGNNIKLSEDTKIDLGAIGKGIGCDEIERYLDERKDVGGALVNLGGSSILTYGSKPTGDPWKVAIMNPRGEEYLGYIELEGTNHISTSGDYEKYFEKDGIRYHHILDPTTGYPANSGLISVTTVSAKGADSDGLSTACFVLGMDEATELLKEYNVEGIFVDKDKNIYITDGLKSKFTLIAEGYNLT